MCEFFFLGGGGGGGGHALGKMSVFREIGHVAFIAGGVVFFFVGGGGGGGKQGTLWSMRKWLGVH